MLCSINPFRAFSTHRIAKRGVAAGGDADKLLNLVPVATRQDGCATAAESVIENHFEKGLGADEAAPSNLQAGGTRFVVSQTSGATRRALRSEWDSRDSSIHLTRSTGKMPVGLTNKMSVLHVALGTSASTI
jgi:hypothetical protein